MLDSQLANSRFVASSLETSLTVRGKASMSQKPHILSQYQSSLELRRNQNGESDSGLDGKIRDFCCNCDCVSEGDTTTVPPSSSPSSKYIDNDIKLLSIIVTIINGNLNTDRADRADPTNQNCLYISTFRI